MLYYSHKNFSHLLTVCHLNPYSQSTFNKSSLSILLYFFKALNTYFPFAKKCSHISLTRNTWSTQLHFLLKSHCSSHTTCILSDPLYQYPSIHLIVNRLMSLKFTLILIAFTFIQGNYTFTYPKRKDCLKTGFCIVLFLKLMNIVWRVIPFKILLLLDNAPGLPPYLANLNPEVKVVFLLPNTIPLIHPLLH